MAKIIRKKGRDSVTGQPVDVDLAVEELADGRNAGLLLIADNPLDTIVQPSENLFRGPQFTVDMSNVANNNEIPDTDGYRNMVINVTGLTAAGFEVKGYTNDAQDVLGTVIGFIKASAAPGSVPAVDMVGSFTWQSANPLYFSKIRINPATTGVETGTFNVTLCGGQ